MYGVLRITIEARDKVKCELRVASCELRVASCELQKVTLYHNIYLQSFSTLKTAFKLHDLSYIVQLL